MIEATSAAPAPSSHRPEGWWRSAVVYQIYPRSFADGNGDGVGDLRGICRRVDYLAELGVDVVWLSPVYTSPMDDNGYDISDYRDIDPLFGTLADFDELIDRLHARGIKLVMDLVVNHTSDEHPWFVESRDPSSSKRDWYWWRPPRQGVEPGTPGAEPTNWASSFSGPSWTFDPSSGEYYLHIFSKKQPDLNWENPEVRQAVYAMMRWWVDRGVDGFRMDVINMISKRPDFADVALAPGQRYASAEEYLINGPRLLEYLSEMNAEVGLDERRLLTVGEMPGSTVDLARDVTAARHHRLGMVFTFEHMRIDTEPGGKRWDSIPLRLSALKQNLAHWQYGLADEGWNSLYWDNHDQPRAVSRFGDDSPEHRVNSAKTLASVLHVHRGTPYVYQGEELGMTNTTFTSIEEYRDIESVNYHADALSLGMEAEAVLCSLALQSRDNARTPMQWDDTSHGGFSSAIPWLPVNPNYVTINASAQVADPDSVWAHYQRLIALRHREPVLVDGAFELLLPDHEQLWIVQRRLAESADADARLLVLVANCSSAQVTVPDGALPDLGGARIALATHANRSLDLLPWESRIYLVG